MKAFVLAGGQSSRMGRDKATLSLGGRPLVVHALEKLRALGFSPQIVIGQSGSRPDLAVFAPVIADNYAGLGPLGGIEAALSASDAALNLFLPVDLPLLPVEFLRWMVDRAQQTQALATIPFVQDRPQPLCAVYSRELAPIARAALAAGDAKVMRVVRQASSALHLPLDSFDVETVAAALAFSAGWPRRPVYQWFDNLNTPEDFERSALEQMPSFE